MNGNGKPVTDHGGHPDPVAAEPITSGTPATPDSGAGDTPAWVLEGTVPTLDGLRAVSIAMVLVHHMMLAAGRGGSGVAGFVGVDIFFVISGFLITLLLLREQRRTGAISLGGFFLRRAVRILPAYGAFLLVVFALQSSGVAPLSAGQWAALLTYTVNFTHVPWAVSHVWSLCVEEHFYLLWPFVLVALGPHHGGRVALGCLLVTPLVRLAVVVFAPGALDLIKSTPSRMDTIAVGCCLAYLAATPAACRRFRFSPRQAAGLAAAVVLGLFAFKAALVALGDRFMVVYPSLNALAVGGLVWLCVHHADSAPGRVLNSTPFVTVGVLSYSIYIWHKLFITPHHSGWLTEWPVNLVPLVAVPLASYHLIEKPFLRLKDRLRRPAARLERNGRP